MPGTRVHLDRPDGRPAAHREAGRRGVCTLAGHASAAQWAGEWTGLLLYKPAEAGKKEEWAVSEECVCVQCVRERVV